MKSLMEQLSKNPLQIALVENEQLRQQLAKANERVRELEKELINHKNVNKNIHLKNTGIATLVSELTGNNVVLPKMKSRVEIKKALNKFALEQRQEAVEEYKKSDEFCKLLDSHFNSGKVYGHNEYYEQLRKEQE